MGKDLRLSGNRTLRSGVNEDRKFKPLIWSMSGRVVKLLRETESTTTVFH